jgi:hypothetical protein
LEPRGELTVGARHHHRALALARALPQKMRAAAFTAVVVAALAGAAGAAGAMGLRAEEAGDERRAASDILLEAHGSSSWKMDDLVKMEGATHVRSVAAGLYYKAPTTKNSHRIMAKMQKRRFVLEVSAERRACAPFIFPILPARRQQAYDVNPNSTPTLTFLRSLAAFPAS